MDVLVSVKKPAYEYMEEDGRLDDLPEDDFEAIEQAYKRHTTTVDTVETALDEHDISYDISSVTELDEMTEEYDTVISLGGDGTAITTAADIDDELFAPIQSDPSSTAAICTYGHDEAAHLATDLADDTYDIESWTRAAVEHDGEFLGHALNDVYVGKEQIYRPSEYTVHTTDGSHDQLDNGLVIATGTGSTAWYQNTRDNGLAPFSRTAEELRYANMMPMQDTELRQGQIGDDETLEIESLMNVNGAIVLDGNEDAVYAFPRGSTVAISVAEQPLHTIKPQDDTNDL